MRHPRLSHLLIMVMVTPLLGAATGAGSCAIPGGYAGDGGDIVIADFEGTDYGGWTVRGTAFGPGPARGTLPDQMEVTGFQGAGLVNTFHEGDGSTGTLTSPPFVIERAFINFLVGGGCHPGETCMNLEVDGEIVRTVTGPNRNSGGTERLLNCTWDVSALEGRTAMIAIVDRATGGWGHINIDQIVQSERSKGLLVTTGFPFPTEQKLYEGIYRPQFHFTAKKNWLNEPNGLVFYKGEYHMFFQHNPEGINWGNMTWGHAISRDMVHWTELEPKLWPDALGTIFSGSAVVDRKNSAGFQNGPEKTLIAFYTSAGKPFCQSIAFSNDRGRTWTKYDNNPVIGHLSGNNRDPKVIWHGPTQKWIMALYLDKDLFALFASADLKEWTKLHDVKVAGSSECPDFFDLPVDGDGTARKWVFWAANGNYLIGAFDGKRFTSESGPHRSEWGRNCYAAQTWSDVPESDGRRLQIAWMARGAYPGMPFNQQMCFPRTLTLRTTPDGIRLFREPVSEIESLHGTVHTWADVILEPKENLLQGLAGDLLHIRAEVELRTGAGFCFEVNGQKIEYSGESRTVSCLGCDAPLAPRDGRIILEILADRTSLEVFGNNGRVSLSSCFLPDVTDRAPVFRAVGAPLEIVSLEVHELRSIWKDGG